MEPAWEDAQERANGFCRSIRAHATRSIREAKRREARKGVERLPVCFFCVFFLSTPVLMGAERALPARGQPPVVDVHQGARGRDGAKRPCQLHRAGGDGRGGDREAARAAALARALGRQSLGHMHTSKAQACVFQATVDSFSVVCVCVHSSNQLRSSGQAALLCTAGEKEISRTKFQQKRPSKNTKK